MKSFFKILGYLAFAFFIVVIVFGSVKLSRILNANEMLHHHAMAMRYAKDKEDLLYCAEKYDIWKCQHLLDMNLRELDRRIEHHLKIAEKLK